MESKGNSYFPELEFLDNNKIHNKWGIYNLRIVHNKYVASEYQWVYNYFDGERVKYIHSYDLRLLRKKVLEKGYDWIILDEKLAVESYKLNNELIAKRNQYIRNCDYNVKSQGSSGVNFVTLNNNEWVYNSDGLIINGETLSDLKVKVLANNGYWIIKDEVLYYDNLKKEKEKIDK